MVKKKHKVTLELELTIGKGVLGKDGEPFAPGTMFRTSNGMHSLVSFTPQNVINLLFTKDVNEINIIDPNNQEYEVRITRI